MHKITISIIDHVGIKAGMDYYSGSLASSLKKQGCKVIVYSNFSGVVGNGIEYKEFFDGHSKHNPLFKLFRLLGATLKAVVNAKIQHSDLVILHLFSASFVMLFLVTIPKIFGMKIAVISHDVFSLAG